MVTHKQQIIAILNTNTVSYEQGDIAPCYNCYLNAVKKGVGYKEEIYRVIVRATTNENLTLAINSFLQLHSVHGSGYEQTDASYPDYIEMHIIFEADEGTETEIECIARWNV